MSKKSNQEKRFKQKKIKVKSNSQIVAASTTEDEITTSADRVIATGPITVGEVGWMRHNGIVAKIKVLSTRKDRYHSVDILHVKNVDKDKSFYTTDIFANDFCRDLAPISLHEMQTTSQRIHRIQEDLEYYRKDLASKEAKNDKLVIQYLELKAKLP